MADLGRSIAAEVQRFLRPLTDLAYARDPAAATRRLLRRAGWTVPVTLDPVPLLDAVAELQSGVTALLDDPVPDSLGEVATWLQTVLDLAEQARTIGETIGQAVGPPGASAALLGELAADVTGLLLVQWAGNRRPLLDLAALTGVYQIVDSPAVGEGGWARPSGRRAVFHPEAVLTFAGDPLGSLTARFAPDGWATSEGAALSGVLVQGALGPFVTRHGGRWAVDPAMLRQSGGPGQAGWTAAIALPAPVNPPGGDAVVTAEVTFVSAADTDSTGISGPAVEIRPSGSFGGTIAGSPWTVTTTFDVQTASGPVSPTDSIVVTPDGVRGPGGLAALADVTVGRTADLVIGSAATGLTLGDVSLRLFASIDGDGADAGFAVLASRSRLGISTADFGSVVSSIVSFDLAADFDAGVEWSRRGGLRLSGSADLSMPLVSQLVLGPLTVSNVVLELTIADTLGVLVAGDVALTIGPVALVLQHVGVGVDAEPRRTANAPFAIGLAAQPPTGAGLAVDAGVVSGGGFLEIISATGSYEGVVDLQALGVGISAVVIVDTEVPGSDGWSMFLALFLSLPSIQLGFGFTLTGVGGVAGVNRTLDPEALGAAVRTGALDAVLFPDDPIADAPAIIDTFGQIFPPAPGQVVFGPVVRIGWGTPSLVEAVLGIVIALPDPVLLAVVGSVTAVLPTADLDLVSIHLDVGGVIDVTAGTLSVSAALHDSTIVGFALSGGMELRADFGAKPSFLLALGGFHPGFKDVPPGFPDVARLQLALTSNPLFNVSCRSYLAIVANTVQFGAALDVSAEISGFRIAGGASFDALVEFGPFHLTTQVGMYISVSAVGIDLAGVWLDLEVRGPNRWVFDGLARFTVLGFEEQIEVHEQIGSARQEPPVPAVDPRPAILAALELAEAWTVVGALGGSGVTVAASGSAIAAAPDAGLAVGQRVAPLGIELTHIGESPIGDYRTFTIEARPASLPVTGETTDWFAPAQFLDIDATAALGGPSFERLANGVTLGGAVPTAGAALASTLAYEQILRDPSMGIDSLTLDDTHDPTGDDRLLIGTSFGGSLAGGPYTMASGDVPAMTDIQYAVVNATTGATLATATSWSAAHATRRASEAIVPTWELAR
jgi:hypothetical protein